MAIQDFVSKGQKKYSAKINTMKASYTAAAQRAIANYSKAGFGTVRNSAYRTALTSYAVEDYNPKAEWADKWATNWAAKMAE